MFISFRPLLARTEMGRNGYCQPVVKHRVVSRPHHHRAADKPAQSQVVLAWLLYGAMFLIAIVLTGIALVLIDDGVGLLGAGLLAPVDLLGLWMSRS